MNVRAAVYVRELVRHIKDDPHACSLLAHLLEVLDVTLADLVPPPEAVDQVYQPAAPAERLYAEPRSTRRRAGARR